MPKFLESIEFPGQYTILPNPGTVGQVLTLQADGIGVTFQDASAASLAIYDQFTGLPLFDRFGIFVEVETQLDNKPLQDYGRNDSTTFCLDLGNRF